MRTVESHIPDDYLLEIEALQDALFTLQKIAEEHNNKCPGYKIKVTIELQDDLQL